MTAGLALDPALRLAARGMLSLLFLRAAGHKLRDLGAFRAAVAGYRIVPPAGVAVFAGALGLAELAVAVALWTPLAAPLAARGAAGLLTLYSAAIAINLLRGRRQIDCGCAGPGASRPLGAGLLLRNAALVGVALLCTLPVSGRGLIWVDAITVAGGVAVSALLYAAIEARGRAWEWSTH